MNDEDRKTALLSDNTQTGNHFRDYDVHMLIEDDERNYLLKIGSVFERHNGQLSGETIHGRLILKSHGVPVGDCYRDLPIKDIHHVIPPVEDWRPNA